MADDTSPFPPPPPLQPGPPVSVVWWMLWIFATVIAPGLAVPVANRFPAHKISVPFCYGALAVTVIVQILSSVMLGSRRDSGCLTVGLLFGGWLLMPVSFFIGCAAVIRLVH